MTNFKKLSDSKEKKLLKSLGRFSEKLNHPGNSSSNASWACRFVSVESDLVFIKVYFAQLLAICDPLSWDYHFQGFRCQFCRE